MWGWFIYAGIFFSGYLWIDSLLSIRRLAKRVYQDKQFRKEVAAWKTQQQVGR